LKTVNGISIYIPICYGIVSVCRWYTLWIFNLGFPTENPFNRILRLFFNRASDTKPQNKARKKVFYAYNSSFSIPFISFLMLFLIQQKLLDPLLRFFDNFSEALRTKPNTSKADNASSRFVLLCTIETSSKSYSLSTFLLNPVLPFVLF
jgi:hypothetical protein